MRVSQKKPTLGEMKEEAAHMERRAREEEGQQSEMLWNYIHHHALEFCGRAEDIFAPELTVEDPHYETTYGVEELLSFDGKETITENFYDDLDEMVIFELDNELYVKENGIFSDATILFIEEGQRLLDLGFDVDDPDAMYERRFPNAQFWEYTSEPRMIGERLLQAGAFQITKLDPDDVVTFDEQADVWEEYLPKNTDVGPSSLSV